MTAKQNLSDVCAEQHQEVAPKIEELNQSVKPQTPERQSTSSKQSPGSSHRGFAAMNQDLQREIARKGGKAAHQKGTAHKFTSEEAAAAGRKGGLHSSTRPL